jgi:hypothetical protein
MIALENDYAIAFPEAGAGMNIVDNAHPFVTQMAGVVIHLEVVCRPDA